MFPLVENWLQSSLIQKEFSRKHQLHEHVFYYWVARYRKTQPVKQVVQSPPAKTPAAFIHLSAPAPQATLPASDIEVSSTEVALPSGVVLRYSGLVPVAYLKELLSTCSR